MLTGDADAVAQQVAGELGIDQVYSQLLPADKVEQGGAAAERKSPPRKSWPSWATASTTPPSSLVPTSASPWVPWALTPPSRPPTWSSWTMTPSRSPRPSRSPASACGIVYQNIVFALAIKGICLVLGALGIANMWLAIFADVGVMILAVLNAIRALFVKKL